MSSILVPKIKLMDARLRGLCCQACKNLWMADLEELPVKTQSVTGGVNRRRVMAVKCPRCNFASTVTVEDKVESLPDFDRCDATRPPWTMAEVAA